MVCRRTRFPSLRLVPLLTLVCAVPTISAAQDSATIAARHSERLDSAGAVKIACEISRMARNEAAPTRCRPLRYQETSTEIIIRIRETLTTPGPRLEFPLSEVRLDKERDEAVLSRILEP